MRGCGGLYVNLYYVIYRIWVFRDFGIYGELWSGFFRGYGKIIVNNRFG